MLLESTERDKGSFVTYILNIFYVLFPQIILEAKVIHYGSDEWYGQWIKLYFNDGTVKTCVPNYPNLTFTIDDDQYMFANCTY